MLLFAVAPYKNGVALRNGQNNKWEPGVKKTLG